MKIAKTILTLSALVVFGACCSDKTPVYLDESQPIEKRIDDALSRMTLEEKVKILHAQSKFSSAGVPRLGIPELWCTDGPHGIRPDVLWDEWNQAGCTNDSCIAFPALTCLAASWDREISAKYGTAIGEEALFRGKDVLLGPGVNIYRTPLCGRNFEYMGEDPFLSSRMVVPYVKNVQKNGVAACVKHYCLNNEESFRHTIDVDLSDRALYEIYLPAFKAAVQEGGAWSIMSSYNLYRGQHVSHNKRLLVDILKDEWGFDGAVISDWGACSDTDEAITNGLDLEFGSWTDGLTMGKTNAYDSYYLADPYLERLRDGRADMKVLDEKCRRVLRLIFRTSMNSDRKFGSLCSDEHYAAAREIGANGIVLLQNTRNVLPVSKSVRKIVVVGENAKKMMTVGGGSSSLKVQREISPLQGITERAAQDSIEVVWARGYVGSSSYEADGVKAAVDMTEHRSSEELTEEALALAAEADLVIFVGGLNKDWGQDCEGGDRQSLDLPYGQNELISALADVNPDIVVALVSGNAVAMPWLNEVAAIAQVWYGGSEAGHSIADVFFGDVNPSGKLPFTFPNKLEDSPAHHDSLSFPNNGPTFYEEGVLVGYRWYQAKNIDVIFPFGYGLSYTTFELGEPSIHGRTISRDASKPIKIKVPVTNTGSMAGAEVVQLYIETADGYKELKDFDKVYVKPGETKYAELRVDEIALQHYDEASASWKVNGHDHNIFIGTSSESLPIQFSISYR